MPNKKFYEANKDRLKEKAAQYYVDNREHILERCKKYQAENRPRYATLALKDLHHMMANDGEKLIYTRTKNRAKRSGIEFNLDIEDIKIPEFCPILGIKLEFGNKITAPSIDRINCNYGYIKGNVAIISNRANMIKNSGSAEEHEAIAKWMRSFDSVG